MIDAILSTLVGGMLALVGAFVGPFFQRKHERWLARREDHAVLRAKAEELFAELAVLTAQSGQASVRTVERLRNESLDSIPLPDLNRIRSLSTVYYPKLLPHVTAFEEDRKAMFEKLLPSLRVAGEEADPEAIKGLTVVMAIQYQQLASKLVRAFQEEMIEVAPKFEDGAK